jgi:uncharacterized membrane protein YhiD involved in acid resistance
MILNQNLQNKLFIIGGIIALIIVVILFSLSPSGIDRINQKINRLEEDNRKQQQYINQKNKQLLLNEIEKRSLRDSILLLKKDKVKLKQDIVIEKEKFKEISGRYKKLSNDSLVKKLNSI